MTEVILNQKELLYEQIARTIGGDVTPQRVSAVIQGLKEGGHYVHGIKKTEYKSDVLEKGILPLTPEGGASYWTSGESVFGSLTAKNELQSYDTTFFQYAHARSGDQSKSVMLMAITNKDLLKQHGIEIKGTDYATIKKPVPREAMALLEVEIPSGNGSARQQGQAIEQQMFSLLENVLKNGYQAGQVISPLAEART